MDKETEAAIIGDFMPNEVIEEHERNYREHKAAGTLTEDVTFTYSWHLIKSRYKQDIKKGIKMMEGLIRAGKDQRDIYYFVSLGHYKLEEYEEAERCVDRILQMEPTNRQAKELKQLITQKIRKDGLLGLGVLGGAAVLGGVLAVGAVALTAIGVAKAKK